MKLIILLLIGLVTTLSTHAQELMVVGSTSFTPLLKAIRSGYQQEVQVSIRPLGSSAGLAAIIDGESDIAMLSRPLSDAEKSLHPYLHSHHVANDALVFIVNRNNPVENLSDQQIRDIYSGEIHHWHEVDGNIQLQDIRLFSKASQHGTFAAFLQLFSLNAKNVDGDTLAFRELHSNDYGPNVSTYSRFNQAMASVVRNPDGIAFDSWGAIYAAQNNRAYKQIKLLKINGIKPGYQEISEGRYQWIRPLILVTDNRRESTNRDQFISYLKSPASRSLIVNSGYVPQH